MKKPMIVQSFFVSFWMMFCGCAWAQITQTVPGNTTRNVDKDAEQMVEIQCKQDNGVDTRYTLDMLNSRLYVTGTMERGRDGLPISITDREIRHETRVDGEVFSLVVIDRFTLEMRTFAALFRSLTKNNDGWIRGQCEVLKKRLL